MNSTLVSILIPVYNRKNIIVETINCAINQTYDNFEVIVCDNKSTDGTWEILKDFSQNDSRIKIYQNEKNIGPVRNWNRCFEEANGSYFKILWSDDIISVDFLEETVPVLEKNKDVGFVFTKTELFFETGIKMEAHRFGKSGIYSGLNFVKAHLLNNKKAPVSPGNALFRSSDVRKNIIIDINNPRNLDFSRYGAGNDLLIFLLALENYSSFYFVDKTLSFFRVHSDSFTESNNLDEYYCFAKKYFLEKTSKFLNLKDGYYSFLRLKYPYMVQNENYTTSFGFLVKVFWSKFKRKILG